MITKIRKALMIVPLVAIIAYLHGYEFDTWQIVIAAICFALGKNDRDNTAY